MDRERSAAALGLVACLAVVVLAGVPYLVARPSAVAVYYDAGFAGPWLVSLFAAVVAIALLAGVRRRSDPATAAGVAVVLGLFGAVVAGSWALGVSPSLVGGFTDVDAFRYHRWSLAIAALGVAAASGWYAGIVLEAG